jgi:hypothetical protein
MLRFITHSKRNLNVIMRLFVASVMTGLLVFGVASPIWATVDLTAYLPLEGSPITPTFKFSKNVSFDYSNGGKLKDALNGKSITVNFTDDSDNNPSIKSFMEQINTQLANRKSLATITKLLVDYNAVINGDNKGASIDYLITLNPTVSGYILTKGTGTESTVFDAAWIGFNMADPVTITTKQYGDLEINSPLGVIQNQIPDAFNVLKGTKAETDLNTNLIDASTLLAQPLDKWDTLFDPSYVVKDSDALGFAGKRVAVTTLASGTSGVQQGSLHVKNIDEDFTADVTYHLKTVERAGSGTINVDGHALGYYVQGEPAISTTAQASTTTSTATAGGLSTMTIYAMAGLAAVIAGGIFWWSNKKMKDSLKRVKDTGPSKPIEYEERKHWADRFDDDKKSAT